jgi:OFA family oxalate/formate antiporter-like MFS transporter
VLELCLGTFYAWSIFKAPLMAEPCKWDASQVQWPMTLNAIFTGLAAFIIGARADRSPRSVALWSGILWGIGLLGGGYAVATQNLPMLCVIFGVVGGIGIGLGYITGIAVPLKWCPQLKGLVSGIVIMAFGAGGMVIAKLGPGWMKDMGPTGPSTFLYGMGATALVLCLLSTMGISNPPTYVPKAKPSNLASLLPAEVLGSGKFWAIWLMTFINVYAGFAVISQASPMGVKLMGLTTEEAGLLVMLMLLSNGLGRIFWSSLSDKIGARTVLVIMFFSLLAVFAAFLAVFAKVINIQSTVVFSAMCCYVTLCYGGIFGTMPAFAAGIFGPSQMGRFYGPVLTAISAGAVFVQFFFSNLIKTHGYPLPFTLICVTLLVATVLPFLVRSSAAPAETPKPAGPQLARK